MKPKEQIARFIQRAYEKTSGNSRSGTPPEEEDMIRRMFDGMSTGTARIVIEKEVGESVSGDFDIAPLENKGRYYSARIVGADGNTIQRLLVDKQTGNVQMVGS